MDKFYQEFLNPTNAYRGKPFWAWNGKLEEQELLRQIHVMKEMGFGGFFMHSRTGLNTQYLGDEWFRLISACTEEAEKLGMESWIYDEDRWPSGSAGGIVTKNPEFRRKYLTLYLEREPRINQNTIAVFRGVVDGFNLKEGYVQVPLSEVKSTFIADDEVFLSFCWRTMRQQSVFNGYTDLDRLNLRATQEFIRVTHEQYKEKCGKSFNKIYGVFTDEPTHGPVFSDFGDAGEEQKWSVPWTDDLAEVFLEEYGYDLIPRLPELFLVNNDEQVSKIKWQYMELIQKLFIERFLKPVQQWAHANNMITTGHFVNEDSLASQAVPVGSMLRSYAYLDHPGIDCLTDCRYIPWAVKVLESAARQNGQTWKLSELYGATGWHMSFQDYKFVGDWQAVLGINVRCQHLSWYTMEGEAKRDYPGSFLHQATWYQEHSSLETYFARLGYISTQGTPECETLVLHPIESIWTQIHPEWVQTLDGTDPLVIQLEKKFTQLFDWLTETQVDFDYGDEGVLAERAIVEKNAAGCMLQVGNMKYRRIIVSGCLTIRESTCQLLENFQRRGGELIFIGTPPKYVSCEESSRCRNLSGYAKKLSFRRRDVLQYFERIEQSVRVINAEARKDLYLQIRNCGEKKFVLLLNKNRKKSYTQVGIQIGNDRCAEKWDCFSGESYDIMVQNGVIYLDFEPGQEYVICLKDIPADYEKNVRDDLQNIVQEHLRTEHITERKFQTTHLLRKVRNYSLDEKNIYVLDRVDLWADGINIAKDEETLQADRKLRLYLGVEPRGGEMLQPWAIQDADRVLSSVRLHYCFDIETMPQTPVYLVAEPMPHMKIMINGNADALTETDIFWVDRCFKVYQITSGNLHVGENELEITADYLEQGGLENLYLLGDFGVFCRRDKMKIGNLPSTIRIGDLTSQGFPFYSGKITYYFDLPCEAPVLELSLRLPKIGGSCAAASFAGEEQMIPWTWRTVGWCGEKASKDLAVTVVTNRRNTFGPLHQFPIKQPYIAPDSFVCDDITQYGLYPTGLLAAPQIMQK